MGALPGVTGVLTGLVLGGTVVACHRSLLVQRTLHLIYLENCANKTSARFRSDADPLPPARVKSHRRVVVHTDSRSHARGADSVRDLTRFGVRGRLGGTSDPRARPAQEDRDGIVTRGAYRTGEKAAGISSLLSCRIGRTPVCGGHGPPAWRGGAPAPGAALGGLCHTG